MQWLIDLVAERVIATIGVPPCYINRGDPLVYDYDKTDLDADDDWHTLDLSGIVGEGATAVDIKVQIESNAVEDYILFKRQGAAGGAPTNIVSTQVANVILTDLVIVPVLANRLISYRLGLGFWTTVNIVIKGWWL